MDDAASAAKWLKENKVDLLLINVGDLIPEGVYTAPKFGSINIHPSELPRHRGAVPTLWTLKHGDTTSAVTYHLLDRKADAGDILKQIRFEVSPDETWQKFEEKVDAIVRETLADTIVGWIEGRIAPQKQDSARGTKTARFNEYREIDLAGESAKEIAAKIQYYAHWTPSTACFFRFGKSTVPVCDAQVVGCSDNSATPPPGAIWRKGARLVLQTKDGKLSVNLLTGMSAIVSGRLLLQYLKQVKPTNIARPLELIVGYTGNWLIVKAGDYVLYPFVIYKLGLLHGGIVMSLFSFLVCLLTLWFYDWSKRDWLGIEAIKQLKDYEGAGWFQRQLSRLLRKGDPVACVVLSIKFDPFITTAYMRHGAFTGMSRRDWKIFVASWLIGNVYWSFVCFGGVSALVWLWHRLR
jgi:methionyl-tRNA formyltransferase